MFKQRVKVLVYTIIRFLYKNFVDSRPVWLFSSWNGELYSDNPKYLFEYIKNSENTAINCIWITNNDLLYSTLKSKKVDAWLINKWKNHLCQAIADKFFFSDTTAPLNHKARTSTKFINLWHGMPIKQIGNHQTNFDFFTVTNPTSATIIGEAFGLAPEKVLVIGQAKNDGLFTKKKIQQQIGIPEDAKIITYMPTYRGSFYSSAIARNNQSGIFIDNTIKDSKAFPTFIATLEKHNAYFIVKPHIRNKASLDIHPRLIVLDEFADLIPEFDNYEILGNTDILVSDFSSLILDFYATDKPMLFYAPDWKEYCEEQKLYFDYQWLAGHHIVENFEELTLAIIDSLENNNTKYIPSQNLKSHFNTYHESGHCKRIFEYFKKID